MAHYMSEEVLRIVRDYWPDDTRMSLPLFREMQVELIRYHFPNMSQDEQVRALDTIVRLQKNDYEDLI